MKSLYIKAFNGLLQLIVIMAAALFISAKTLRYWQAWVFLSVFFIAVVAITLYLVKKDPKLLERRVKAGTAAETRRSQKINQFIAAIAFVLIFILSAIDHRFGWSVLPDYVVIAGDLLVAFGLLA